MDFLLKPLGWILQQLSLLFNGNFALAVFMFTFIVNLAMIPLSIKTQKSSVSQMRIKPKMDVLKQKYGNDQQRYSAEVQKLYQEENVSMSGGCLPMLIRFPIMIGIYNVVLSPLKYIVGVSSEILTSATEAFTNIFGKTKGGYIEPEILGAIKNGTIQGYDEIATKLTNYDFTFLGIDLTSKPKFDIDIIHGFDINWFIPILAFAAAMLTSIVSLAIQKKVNPDAPQMKGMMLTMPLISLFIGFTVSCAAGFYWACSSLISGGIQAIIQYFYGPQKMIAIEQTKEHYKRSKEEKEIINKSK